MSEKRGRTLWEILTNKTPSEKINELRYHNPLEAKIGSMICFDHEPEIDGINFSVEKISVYETKINRESFFHTDYHIKGISLDKDHPVRLRLRLIADETNQLGHHCQLLHLYHQMEFDQNFHDNVLCDQSGEFHVNHDDEGNELEHPRRYWRVGDVLVPYKCWVTDLKDADDDGVVEDNEVIVRKCTYWDYSRLTDHNDQEITEYLTVEMEANTGYFTFLRGTEVLLSQITVI